MTDEPVSRLRAVDLRRAALEGLAVLVGILTAFGIDAWWDVRTEAAEAEAYQAALLDEVRANRHLLAGLIESETRFEVGIMGGFMTSVVHAEGPVADSTILKMFWDIGPGGATQYRRAALSDLLSSGGLAAIADGRVRRAITEYELALGIEETRQAQADATWWGKILPYGSEHMGLDDIFPDEFARDYLGTPQMLDGAFAVDTEAFVRNRDWANLLTELIYVSRELARERADLAAAMDDLIAALGG
ncbi:MAG: hypothetical protein RLN75_02155 [Longimicrobiales bacterium]